MKTISQRQADFQQLVQLNQLCDQEVSELIGQTKASIGGGTTVIKFQGKTVFIKKIALTDLERRAENMMSTANLFNLPLFYQYRLGSNGFGAWRELVAHIMATKWVLTEQCPYFPLLYHYRILEKVDTESNAEQFNESVKFWHDDAITARLNSIASATAEIVLFLEYVPQTLNQWLDEHPEIESITDQLQSILAFMTSQNFVHFDAHFDNILCDGNIYLSDFGLASSAEFRLSTDEKAFLEKHRSYDRAVVESSLDKTGEIATALKNFYGALRHDFNTPYSQTAMEVLVQKKAVISDC